MQFLADESCDFAVVRALRDGGHDVIAVAEVARGVEDPQIVRMAREQGRVLLTEDKDFGWHVYVSGEGGVGVVLVRFPAMARRLVGAAVLEAVRSLADRLAESFVVVEPGRVRVSPTPPIERRS